MTTGSRCPHCGEPLVVPCEVAGCGNEWAYEGWWRVVDFTGTPTGLMQRRKVCEQHKNLLYNPSEDDNAKT